MSVPALYIAGDCDLVVSFPGMHQLIPTCRRPFRSFAGQSCFQDAGTERRSNARAGGQWCNDPISPGSVGTGQRGLVIIRARWRHSAYAAARRRLSEKSPSPSIARRAEPGACLRRDRDILLFDPVHCYGLSGYLEILEVLEARGWPRAALWPHGGHLFCLHVAAALGLGGAEVNPLCFQPFGGCGDDMRVVAGATEPPTVPGIGSELKRSLRDTFEALLGDELSVRL